MPSGKNVIALGAKSAAFCEESDALSRAAFAAGYRTQARKGLSTDPGGEASDGIGATALGENTRAAGDGAFAAGKNVQAYGGSIAIGSGINDGNPAVNSHKDSVMLFAKSLIPGIAVVPGGGGLGDPSRVGVHTKYPKEIVDVVLEGGAAQPSEYQGQELVSSCCKGQITTAIHLLSRRLNGQVPMVVAQ